MLLATAGLAWRVEREDAFNAAEAARAYALVCPGTGSESIEVAGGQVAFTAPGSPLTHAVGVGLAGPRLEDDLNRIEEFYRARGCAAVNIDLTPFSDPIFAEALARRGYRIVEFNNVLARRLAPGQQWPADPRVRAAGPDDGALWAVTVMAGFFEAAEPAPAEVDLGCTLFLMESTAAFLAFEGGAPAGGGTMSVRNGVAYFMGDSSLPGRRGRGIQRALIERRLAHAVESGCDLAAATTLAGTISQRNYERCGFRVLYTKLNMQRDF